MCVEDIRFTRENRRRRSGKSSTLPSGRSTGQLKLGDVFPSDRAPILVASQDKVVVRTAVWGFPGFQGKGLLINARSETAEERPTFREPLLHRRCVVPTTGFYEWSKDKEKHLFQYENSPVVYLAGLWGEIGGKRRYPILTTEPNQAVAAVHNRMPVLLAKEQVRPWLMDTTVALQMLHAKQPELVEELWIDLLEVLWYNSRLLGGK